MKLLLALFLNNLRRADQIVWIGFLIWLRDCAFRYVSIFFRVITQGYERLTSGHILNHFAHLQEVSRSICFQASNAVAEVAFRLVSAREVEYATVVIASTPGYEGEEDRKQHQSFHDHVSYPSFVGGAT